MRSSAVTVFERPPSRAGRLPRCRRRFCAALLGRLERLGGAAPCALGLALRLAVLALAQKLGRALQALPRLAERLRRPLLRAGCLRRTNRLPSVAHDLRRYAGTAARR